MRATCLSIGLSVLIGLCLTSCTGEENKSEKNPPPTTEPFLIVLGVAQDAGFPQAGCAKACCAAAWVNKDERKMVSCLGLIDPANKRTWLFDATPDFKDQLHMLNAAAGKNLDELPDGIFLTHAHIGHYTGLIHLGREVIGASQIPVYVMPRMRDFLSSNGPWEQLVELGQIKLISLVEDSVIDLNGGLSVRPFLVPHRDEYSETVGYEIAGSSRKALFIPDIDKWERWDKNIVEEVAQVDLAFVDATFCKDGELPGRSMSEIPHPFVEETIALFMKQPLSERSKLHFIHLNHTNPLLNPNAAEQTRLRSNGFALAEEGALFMLQD